MKYFVILLLLIILGAGGYFFFFHSSQPKQPETQQSVNIDEISCLDGINGNSGNNYCSNYRGSGSKCTPRMPNTYPDGCTK